MYMEHHQHIFVHTLSYMEAAHLLSHQPFLLAERLFFLAL